LAGDSTARFSLVAGGPFDAILDRFGLIGPDRVPTWGAAVALALAAWLFPGLLAVAEFLIAGSRSGLGYFTDGTVYARYLVAIGVMVGTDRYADWRLTRLIRNFHESRLLPQESLPAFSSAVAVADRRSSSAPAELLIFAIALVWSGLTFAYAVDLARSSWEGALVLGVTKLSWAGEAARFVSNPLFIFLALRWIWRLAVWTQLLFRIARMPLRLTPLHPDHAAGLGFLSVYPGIFSGFAFALSGVVAASILKELALHAHDAQTVWLALAVWLGICFVVVLGPLVVFAWPLYQLRERALVEYGRLATQHHLAFHHKWIGEKRNGEALMGSPDPSSASDINATVAAVQDMRFFPVDGPAVVQLLIAAGVPLLAVVAMQVPVGEIAQWLFGRIF
jgi:hypothetical protein